MKHMLKRILGISLICAGAALALWIYQTYVRPEQTTVVLMQRTVDQNITALMKDLPTANPDMSQYPVTIENCGRTLTFDAPPKRVIGLWQPSNELLLALGVHEHVIGFGGMYDAIPTVFAPQTESIPALGSIMTLNIPNKEEMIKAHPDLIVTEGLDTFAFDSAQGFATVTEIEQMGAQIYSSGSICNFKQSQNSRGTEVVYDDLKTLGRIFGVSSRAEAIVDRLKRREQAVLTAVANQPRVSVAFFNGDATAIYILNSGIWADLMEKAGGKNVFTGQDVTGIVSPEVFSRIDADVILYGIFPTQSVMPGRNSADIAQYLTNTFPQIPAVKNQRLYPISTINTEASIRVIDGLEQIARALHPTAFPANEEK
jgi:iron complex transport system substrate-binding protein